MRNKTKEKKRLKRKQKKLFLSLSLLSSSSSSSYHHRRPEAHPHKVDDLPGDRRRPRRHEPDPASQLRPHFRKDQRVPKRSRDPSPARVPAGERGPFRAVRRLEEPPRHGAALPDLAQHAVVDPVPQARDRTKYRRPQEQDVVEQGLDVARVEPDRRAAVGEAQHGHPLVDVREGQVGDVHVPGPGLEDAERAGGVGDEVGVGQHSALGHARGARGVADRRDVLGPRRAVLDLRQILPPGRRELVDGDDAGVGGPRRGRVRHPSRRQAKDDDEPDGRAAGQRVQQRRQRLARASNDGELRVPADVRHGVLAQRVVERHRHHRLRVRRGVEQDPVAAVYRVEAHAVLARGDPEGNEPGAEGVADGPCLGVGHPVVLRARAARGVREALAEEGFLEFFFFFFLVGRG